jgi:hypothetical protein
MTLSLPRQGVCLFSGQPASGKAIATVLDDATVLSASDLAELSDGGQSKQLWASRQLSLQALEAHGAPGIREFDFELDDLPVTEILNVQSSGGPGSQSMVVQKNSGDRLTRGLHLYAIAGNGERELLASIDPCGGDVDVPIAGLIESHAPAASAYLLVAHDSATCGQPLDALFAGTPLTKWQTLGLRQPYVALLTDDDPARNIELVGDAYVSLILTFTPPAQIAGVPAPVYLGSD